MRPIKGYPLWIGTARDARDIKGVLDAGIEAIVDLAPMDEPVRPPRELIYLRFPLVDGADNPPWLITAAVHAVKGLVSLDVPTLVACDGGMSRSVVIAAAALWYHMPLRATLDEALQWLAATGPCDVHPRLWTDVKRFVRLCSEGCYRPRG